MSDHRTIPADRPLRVLLPAALVALVLHGSLLPVAASYLSHQSVPIAPVAEDPQPLPAEPEEQDDQPAAQYPDLTVSAAEFPTSLLPGRPTPLTFDVANRGAADTGPALWGDRVYLSMDELLDDDDVMLVSVPRVVALPARTRYVSGPHLITVPASRVTSPHMFLLVVTDAEDDIDEGQREGNNVRVLPFEVVEADEGREPLELELGRDDAPQRVTVAWVSHDAFQDLLARESRTHQPIVQSRADPSPDAPLEMDPLDTGSSATSATAAMTDTSNPVSENPSPASSSRAAGATTPLPPSPDGALPVAPTASQDSPGEHAKNQQGDPAIPPDTAARASDAPQAPLAPSQRQAERPTSAPRSDREADPTALLDSDRVRPGQVLVGPGLEVRTFRPDFTAAARGFAVPRNPQALITFAPDGSVVAAELTTSTGFANVDSPLLTSLYRWRATGPRLAEFKQPFDVKITILLGGE